MNKDDQQLPATYSVRLPASIRRQLEESARASGRSLHAEILLRLGDSLDASKNAPSAQDGLSASVRELIQKEVTSMSKQLDEKLKAMEELHKEMLEIQASFPKAGIHSP